MCIYRALKLNESVEEGEKMKRGETTTTQRSVVSFLKEDERSFCRFITLATHKDIPVSNVKHHIRAHHAKKE
jgi:hypothetical protein